VSSLISLQQVGEDQFDDTLGGQELEMIKMIEDIDKVQISQQSARYLYVLCKTLIKVTFEK